MFEGFCVFQGVDLLVLTVGQFLLVRTGVLVLQRLDVTGRFVVFAVQMIQLLMLGLLALRVQVLKVLHIGIPPLVLGDVLHVQGLR